jgi:hypothetical protein
MSLQNCLPKLGLHMLKVQCPHCKKLLSLVQRKGLVFLPFITCVHCHKKVQSNKRFRDVNSAMLGIFTYSVGGAFFPDVSKMLILCLGLTFIVCFQGVFDIFFTLESAEDDFDF